jgi:hypothetical protein
MAMVGCFAAKFDFIKTEKRYSIYPTRDFRRGVGAAGGEGREAEGWGVQCAADAGQKSGDNWQHDAKFLERAACAMNMRVVAALLVLLCCVCAMQASAAAAPDCPAPSHSPEDRRLNKTVLRFMVTLALGAPILSANRNCARRNGTSSGFF